MKSRRFLGDWPVESATMLREQLTTSRAGNIAKTHLADQIDIAIR